MDKTEDRHAYSPPENPRLIGVYDLRTHWYEYLRRARDGEVFIITRRGRPVARLEGLPPDHPAHRKDVPRKYWKPGVNDDEFR